MSGKCKLCDENLLPSERRIHPEICKMRSEKCVYCEEHMPYCFLKPELHNCWMSGMPIVYNESGQSEKYSNSRKENDAVGYSSTSNSSRDNFKIDTQNCPLCSKSFPVDRFDTHVRACAENKTHCYLCKKDFFGDQKEHFMKCSGKEPNKKKEKQKKEKSEELVMQKKLRSEVIQLEDGLAQVCKENEMLRVELEQNLAAYEQTGPITREMRHIITSLQNHQWAEVQRFKRILKEMTAEIMKLQISKKSQPLEAVKEEPSTSVQVNEEIVIKKEEDHFREEETDLREKDKSDAEIIRDLKSQLKKSQKAQKELKLLLDMYKGAPKEQRDKAQLMAGEKKARAEVEELRNQIKRSLDNERKERRKLADEEALKKIKALEDQLQSLQKQLTSQKQEEEALLNEMDITGQAFEDMQEQNLRLIQQLSEKDDANFKLMSKTSRLRKRKGLEPPVAKVKSKLRKIQEEDVAMAESGDSVQEPKQTRSLPLRKKLVAKAKRFVCLACGISLSTASNLRRHERFKHGDGEPLRCPKCPVLTFATPYTLARHKRQQHGSPARRAK